MSESWDDYAEGWDSNDAVIAYSTKAYQSLTDVIKIKGVRVLDFGCGTGLLSERMSKQVDSIVAIDPSQKMIDVLNAKQLSNVTTIRAKLTQKLAEESQLFVPKFDLIVASSVLAFVDDYRETLHNLKGLLNPGGYIVQWDWLKEDGQTEIGFSEEEVYETFVECKLSEVSVTIPFSLESEGNTMKVVMGVGKNS